MKAAICLDCGAVLPPIHDEAYRGTGRSRVYLCPMCRTVRYPSEAAAWARCVAGIERRWGRGVEVSRV